MLQRFAIMNTRRMTIIALVTLLLGAMVVTSMPTTAIAGSATYYPVGPQRSVPISTLTNAGWVRCFSETWDSETTKLSDIQSNCKGSKLILTGRPVGASVLTLLAAAPRSIVFGVTTDNAPVYSNGSWWYYTPVLSYSSATDGNSGSMGFSDTAVINQNTCDFPTHLLRLCWHIGYGDRLVGGYQMDGINLNGSTDFLREIYMLGGCDRGSRTRERCRPTR